MRLYRDNVSRGFALPTVVIASVVMFAVLVAVSGVVASSRVSLDTQYYEGLATDAAESGGEVADNCLKGNGYVSTWGSNSLKPNTNCSGAVVAGQSNTVVRNPAHSTRPIPSVLLRHQEPARRRFRLQVPST